MTLCPIAVLAGCQKCPAFKLCPLKTLIGDQPGASAAPAKTGSASKTRAAAARKKK